MPAKPPRACRKAGCSGTTVERHGYCEAHAHLASGYLMQGKYRGSAHQRGYGARWKRIRDRVMLRDRHLCQPCERENRITPAKAVDHIIPKFEGGTDADSNLEAICDPCHRKKTQQESIRARKGGVGSK
ncbi:HNH endonuclease [Microbulbifer agarilyticus]|uniref:Putative HNH nuclease YajD n=2 Tax=Microbulbifer agarilyticus TaxID=260552 RepID=A0A1Q2M4L0_9GAMM|nr:HNH endonuclease [Microbulbifer agarilyticus]